MSNKHCLKIWPEFFQPVWDDLKLFELRHDDRGYRAGDILILQEWSKDRGYTGREITVHVVYILSGLGLQKDWVVMSFEILTKDHEL